MFAEWQTKRPRVAIVSTGGTIAGSSAGVTDQRYQAGALGLNDLLETVPGLDSIADLRSVELLQLDSSEFDVPEFALIARQVRELVSANDLDGVVITHGTDTMEETAYFVSLTVSSDKPVVLTGSMLPADAVGADGPTNLRDAVAAAASRFARGRGTFVVFDGTVYAGRDAVKAHTVAVDAFASADGPLGWVLGGEPVFARTIDRRTGPTSAFADVQLDELPPVGIVTGHAGLSPALMESITAAGLAGLVHIGPGAGNVSSRVAAWLGELAASGVVVVRTSRVSAGPVVRNDAITDDRYGWVAAGDLNPAKARVLLTLALTITRDPLAVQEIFNTH